MAVAAALSGLLHRYAFRYAPWRVSPKIPTFWPDTRSVSQGRTLANGVPSALPQLLESHLKSDSAIRASSVSSGNSNSWLPKVA